MVRRVRSGENGGEMEIACPPDPESDTVSPLAMCGGAVRNQRCGPLSRIGPRAIALAKTVCEVCMSRKEKRILLQVEIVWVPQRGAMGVGSAKCGMTMHCPAFSAQLS